MNQTKRARSALAILFALSLGASACSSDSEDSSETKLGGEFERVTTTEATEDDSSFTTVTESDRARQQNEDGLFQDDSDAEASATTTAPDSVDGGFFDETAEPEFDETEGNVFRAYGIRDFVATSRDPLSTFALDVDTGSYSITRTWLNNGIVPPPESVRVEEYVNSFDYDYRSPDDGLTVVADGGPSPFNQGNIILRLGVSAEEVRNSRRPDASLTFLIDTSGSMDRSDRIVVVKEALETLVLELDRGDTVSIVTFSNGAQVLLEPTSVRDEDIIIDAIHSIRPDGSTNLEAGLVTAYDLADEAYDRDGINRVVLASDGVANVGLSDPDGLAKLIRDDADRGIQLVTLGVGMGNTSDAVMETLADRGDGFYAYANTVEEAEKIFTDDLVSTLLTVAIDGKIQVEFDPDTVARYRLIGYENRAVLDDDFRNDDVDAGELGSGHQATALYELELQPGVRASDAIGDTMLRWEDPETSEVIEGRLGVDVSVISERWSNTADDFKLAVVAATFAEVMRNSPFASGIELSQIAAEAEALRGRGGDIDELANLIRIADDLR
jgi:Ca-activated chloride channel family protein